jgi:hypothetical protein
MGEQLQWTKYKNKGAIETVQIFGIAKIRAPVREDEQLAS